MFRPPGRDCLTFNENRKIIKMCFKIKSSRTQDWFATPGMGMGGGANYVYKPYFTFLTMTHTNLLSSIRKTAHQPSV